MYRKERYSLQKAVLIIMMVLFLLLPVLFISAQIEISPMEGNRIAFHVSTKIPVSVIHAALDGAQIPVHEAGPRDFVIQPEGNGELEITAVLMNRQRTTAVYHVTTIDTQAPVLLRTETGNGKLYLYLSDEASELDRDSMLAVKEADEKMIPVQWDSSRDCAVMDYPESAVRFSICDTAGNKLQLRLAPRE